LAAGLLGHAVRHEDDGDHQKDSGGRGSVVHVVNRRREHVAREFLQISVVGAELPGDHTVRDRTEDGNSDRTTPDVSTRSGEVT